MCGQVENFAPYLLKDGIVQKITVYQDDGSALNAKGEPKASHILERFRFRSDKMVSRETFPNRDKIIENFGVGRKDRYDLFCRLHFQSKNLQESNIML